jgi:hypothetical protein
MNNQNETAWFNKDLLPKAMIDGALGLNGWERLENTKHYKILKSLIDLIEFQNIADIGCGAGELGRVLNCKNYCGFDLPHIVEEVSKKVNPNFNFNYFNSNESDYTTFKDFDLLICNGFISELINPLEVIKKILFFTKKNLIIHRQIFDSITRLVEYKTYANLTTIKSHISKNEFDSLLVNHKILKEIDSEFGKSLLIIRK